MISGPAAQARISGVETAGLLLLSAATLTFETILTRLFSVAQFYHFAFMIVSTALLGFGLSGTVLAIFPLIGSGGTRRGLGRLSLGASAAILGAYLLINNLPFDSFQIAWDRRQALVLAVHYLALALPFFFSGLAVGMLLRADPQRAGQTYALNLFGSALGCGLALVLPVFFGGEGTVLASSLLASSAAFICILEKGSLRSKRSFEVALSTLMALFTAGGLWMSGQPGGYPDLLRLRLSPYKGLSYALQVPGARTASIRWNSFSRVDRIESGSIRSLPGLSYRYLGGLPRQDGLLVDGDDLSPVILEAGESDYAASLPAAVAFALHPGGSALILEPRGGLDILTALRLGAERVVAVEANPLIVQAAGEIYQDPRVEVIVETDRSYASRAGEQFDVIVLSLTSSYHPVRSGAYSLAEDYRYTVEAFQGYLERLKPGGQLVVTRWLQTPPSESLRAFATAVEALEALGLKPRERLVAIRGYNTATILAGREALTPAQLEGILEFAKSQAFDLVYAPDIQPEETNRFNVLPEPTYSRAFQELLEATPREGYYRKYPLEVRPPTDDRPFFGHFFKWSQAGEVISELGKTWQPFGGAGYLVILAVLVLAVAFGGAIILLPAAAYRLRGQKDRSALPDATNRRALAFFGLIGFGYLLVEIPLIQRFILFIGQPAYSLAAVLCSLLLFSGLGSMVSGKVRLNGALGALALSLLALPLGLPRAFELTLGSPFSVRVLISVLLIAPVGFLMGIPFSGGILWLQKRYLNVGLIPWAWAVNGAASVVASVLAALLAISLGFSAVFLVGALCYLAAGAIVTAAERLRPLPPPAR